MPNTIDAALQRDAVLKKALRAFKKRLLALSEIFTVVFSPPLEGTNKVIVPFYDLETADSTDFNDEEGYQTGNSTTDSREIEINQRLYQSLEWSSREQRRIPVFDHEQHVVRKAEKLAADVVGRVLGLITAANFPTVAHTGAASGFDSDDVAALKLAAKTWPENGRSLVVGSEYDSYLLRDDAIKNSLAIATDEAIREGKVGRRLMGFDYYENPNIPDNGENLTGFICAKPAILIAFAPIQPTEDVGRHVIYQKVTDPDSGCVLEYRRWGVADLDSSRSVIECNLGFAVGNADALQRIRSAAP